MLILHWTIAFLPFSSFAIYPNLKNQTFHCYMTYFHLQVKVYVPCAYRLLFSLEYYAFFNSLLNVHFVLWWNSNSNGFATKLNQPTLLFKILYQWTKNKQCIHMPSLYTSASFFNRPGFDSSCQSDQLGQCLMWYSVIF